MGDFNNGVYAIAAPDLTHVYVGGNFTNLAGVAGRDRIAMWNDSAWSTVGNVGDFSNVVYAIVAPDPTHIYVGGDYNDVAGVTGRNRIAMWNGSAWSTVGNLGDFSGAINAIAAPDLAHVYLGGNFTSLTGVISHNYLTMWNGSAWSTSIGCLGDFNVGFKAIAAPDLAHVYVGGQFTNVAGVTGRNYLAMWNGSAWSTVGNLGDLNTTVNAIAAPDPTHVYVSGQFTNLAGVTGRNYLAMWNGSAWSTVGNVGDFNNGVYAIAAPDLTHVYVGGFFTNLAGVTGRDKIAMWNGSAWSTVGNVGDFNNTVFAIAAPDLAHVYVGGDFTNLAGVTGRNRIAMWNGSAWSTVGNLSDFNSTVYAIAAPDPTHVYVGGFFTNLAGVTGRNYLAMWNGSAWSTVGNLGDLNTAVNAIAAPDLTHVYVGGGFNNLAGVTGRNNLAMWNGSAWSTVGNLGDFNNAVNAIAAPDLAHVYVGGYFIGLAGAIDFNYLAMWNGSAWSTVSKVLLTILGDFNILTGTLDSSGAFNEIDLTGSLTNNGNLLLSGSTVVLNGVNQTISGSNTFYNLVKSVTSSAILTFAANAMQTITSALTLNGITGQLLNLVSSIPGTPWNINTTGATTTVDYLSITDSNSNVSILPTHSIDNGNNTNWDIILSPGTINNCGTINQSGTYTLGGNITNISGACFKIRASGVTIDGSANHYSVTATGAGNSSYVVMATGITTNGGAGYGTTTIKNITFTGFAGGINTSGNFGIGTSGGAGGSIVISSSTIGTVLASGGSSDSVNGGSAGVISVTNSTVSSLTSSGGDGASGGNGGNAGPISLTNSTSTGSVISVFGTNGGGAGTNGLGSTVTLINSSTGNVTGTGVGGIIAISGTNLNLSNNTYTAGTTFNVNASGTLTTTNTNLSSLTHFIAQGTDYGTYVGGAFPLFPGTITSCGNLYFAGTYTLIRNTTSNCNILISGITIVGGSYTLTGDVTANNYGVTLSGINVNGNVSSTGASAGTITVNSTSNLNGTTTINGILAGDGSSSIGNTTINSGASVATSSVSFVGNVVNNGTINSGNAVAGKTTNNAIINGDFIFRASSINAGLVNGNATFSTSSNNYFGITTGTVVGTARFNALTASGGVITFAGTTTFAGIGTVNGNISDSSGAPITSWVFNDLSSNVGIIKGNAIFNNTSTNTGTVSGNVTVNSPVVRPLGGMVSGQITYYGYPGLYFNDQSNNDGGHGVVGKWNDVSNWWISAGFTTHSPVVPTAGDDVIIYGNITNGGPASVRSAIFQATSSNAIYLTVMGTSTDATLFNGSSTNAVGGTINGNATFSNGTDNFGTVTGHITRQYSAGVYNITGDLIHNGTLYLVQVIGLGTEVFMASATSYVSAIFQALNNGLFTWGLSHSHINPDLKINSFVTESNAKWSPNISWGTSYLVQYKTDEIGGGVYVSASSTLNGNDIPRPTAGSHTYFFKSTDAQGDVTEKSITFTYNNTLPVSTDCSSPLDEVTRPYYYLSTNVSENCTVTASTTLRGNDVNGNFYTVSGNMTGTNSNISLQNMNVLGLVSNFSNINVISSTLSGGVNVTGSLSADVLSSFGNSTIETAGTVYGGIFTGNVTNNGTIVSGTTTPVSVLGNTTNNGVINGNFVFNATSTNHGAVNGNAVLNGSAINNGTITGKATLNGISLNLGSVGGDLIFNTLTAINGKIVFSSSTIFLGTGHVDGIVKDNPGNTITKWMFNNSSVNAGYTKGDAYFNGSSTNTGTVEGNAYVYTPVAVPLTGLVTGSEGITYHSYPNSISFKNTMGDNSWSNPSNWFTDTLLSTPANRTPNLNEDVVLFATTSLPFDVVNNVYIATSGITIDGKDNKLTGNISGNGAYGGHGAYNFNLQNITVTGTTSAVGGDGIPGISDGGRGGTINIDTASTGGLTVNGGDPLQNGGDAGTSTVTNSFAIVDGTKILAVGGASAGCGYGGNGGNISLIDSSGYILITATGTDATSSCQVDNIILPPPPTSRSGGYATQVGIYISPAVRAANAAAAAVAARGKAPSSSSGSMDPSFLFPGLNTINIGKLNLANLPNLNFSGLSIGNIGVSDLVNPLANLLQLKPITGFVAIPKLDFSSNINNLLNSSLPKSLYDLMNAVPFIKREIASSDIKNGYDLYAMKESPINTPTLSELAKDKTKQPESIVFVSVAGVEKETKLSIDKKGNTYQMITVLPSATLDINVKNTDKVLPKTTFNGLDIKTSKDKQNIIKLSASMPKESGIYILKVGSLVLQVKVYVVSGTGDKIGVTIGKEAQQKKLLPIQKLWSWFKK